MSTFPLSSKRRKLLALGIAFGFNAQEQEMGESRPLTVFTFGDSILDCGRYNSEGIDPGLLLVRNDDRLFPEFKGRELGGGRPARLERHARDGSTVADLPIQASRVRLDAPAVALVTVGGNDLLGGLAGDDGEGIAAFAARVEAFLNALPIRPVLLATVYDPTLGRDDRNFLSVPAPLARRNLNDMNAALRALAPRFGEVADLHAHFMKGSASWFTHTIEPSLIGASEIRRVFLAAAERVLP